MRAALELDRNLACAHGSIGQAKYFIGRGDETEAHVQEALRISPIDTNAYQWIGMAGFAKLHLGRDEEAVVQLRRALEMNRNFPSGQFYLAAALANLGRGDEARSATNCRASPVASYRWGKAGAIPRQTWGASC